jgi:hypothetical protein
MGEPKRDIWKKSSEMGSTEDELMENTSETLDSENLDDQTCTINGKEYYMSKAGCLRLVRPISKGSICEEKPLDLKKQLTLRQKLFADVENIINPKCVNPEALAEMLDDQGYYWINVKCNLTQVQRDKIREYLENHFSTPITWVTDYEIQVDVHPKRRIPKKKNGGK